MASYASVHEWDALGGEGDARPTAAEIIRDYKMEGTLHGSVILITGVSSGFGAATAAAMVATGATLYCAGRDEKKARVALGAIADNPRVYFIELDLLCLASVRSCALKFLIETKGKLNVLINNAGGMVAEHRKSIDGFEQTFAMNFLGHFLLFSLLKDALLASATTELPSRVVNVASIGHIRNEIEFDNLALEGIFTPAKGYGQAKTATVYMASEIDRRSGGRDLHAWSLQPGASLASNFLSNSGLPGEAQKAAKSVWPLKLMKSIQQGAAITVWAAVSEDVLTKDVLGKYLEDCAVAKHTKDTAAPGFLGYGDHTYDEGKAKRLWEIAEEMIKKFE